MFESKIFKKYKIIDYGVFDFFCYYNLIGISYFLYLVSHIKKTKIFPQYIKTHPTVRYFHILISMLPLDVIVADKIILKYLTDLTDKQESSKFI